jgi:hypothetical protein
MFLLVLKFAITMADVESIGNQIVFGAALMLCVAIFICLGLLVADRFRSPRGYEQNPKRRKGKRAGWSDAMSISGPMTRSIFETGTI